MILCILLLPVALSADPEPIFQNHGVAAALRADIVELAPCEPLMYFIGMKNQGNSATNYSPLWDASLDIYLRFEQNPFSIVWQNPDRNRDGAVKRFPELKPGESVYNNRTLVSIRKGATRHGPNLVFQQSGRYTVRGEMELPGGSKAVQTNELVVTVRRWTEDDRAIKKMLDEKELLWTLVHPHPKKGQSEGIAEIVSKFPKSEIADHLRYSLMLHNSPKYEGGKLLTQSDPKKAIEYYLGISERIPLLRFEATKAYYSFLEHSTDYCTTKVIKVLQKNWESFETLAKQLRYDQYETIRDNLAAYLVIAEKREKLKEKEKKSP